MTENQVYPMSSVFFDTSSNSSSNPLKYELYSLSGNNFGTCVVGSLPSLSINTNYITTNPLQSTTASLNAIGSNVMLTTAISIPRSNNPNQSHYPYQLDNTRHHLPSPSPLHSLPSMASSTQQQQQQQQQQQHQQQLNELSEYALDALDAASLSPTLLQDVSLSAASPLNTTLYNGNANSMFKSELSSPLGQLNENTLLSGVVSGSNVFDANSLFEITPNSNTMWSDISSAIVNPKNEPFSLDDDYIFPNDKAEIQACELTNLNSGDFLDVITNFEDLLQPTVVSQSINFMLSPQPSSSNANSLPQLNSPVSPPMELLQQQQHQQQQQNSLPHLQTLFTQQQQQQQHTNLQPSSYTSPYEIFHSTPNKQQQQMSDAFSPGSQPSHSPLQQHHQQQQQQQQQQQLNNSSITPPPPHANRSQYQLVKSRNMQELLKKDLADVSMLGQSVPCNNLLLSGNALSPGSSSGFGSAASGNSTAGTSAVGQVVITADGNLRKSFGYPGGVESAQMSRLSSSAPNNLGLEHIWMRREPRQHLLSTSSLAEAESFSSISTGEVLSPDGIDFSQDDDDDASSDNSDHYDDFSSDGSGDEDETRTSTPNQLSSSKGKERFFWQYNVQAKGPKGKRLVFQCKLEDPHVLNEVSDPVFSPTCSVRGIKVYKHSGKARKGDGNDLTPNARKLHNIGKELDKLSRTINDMTPVSELPFNSRPKSRKEKNKLASRACRLKKKAQHEANKIKLYGLEIEHKRLINGIAELKQALAVKYRTQSKGESTEEVEQQIQRIYTTASSGIRIAGGSTDFVNKVLENMRGGLHNGGLEELRKFS